jgi:hypothetical protein
LVAERLRIVTERMSCVEESRRSEIDVSWGAARIGIATAWLCGCSLLAGGETAASASRFFSSSAQCETAGRLAAQVCRTAFANALAEFTAKAPSFSTRRACFRAFGPCMPWPIGTHRFNEFRPQWIGVEVDEALRVTPAIAPGRHAIAFQPQSTASLSGAALASRPASTDASSVPEARILTPDDDSPGGAAEPAPRAGGGFTVIDGVLTYPAPARFQPKVPRRP